MQWVRLVRQQGRGLAHVRCLTPGIHHICWNISWNNFTSLNTGKAVDNVVVYNAASPWEPFKNYFGIVSARWLPPSIMQNGIRICENSVGSKRLGTCLWIWELVFNQFGHTVVLHSQITNERPQITQEPLGDCSVQSSFFLGHDPRYLLHLIQLNSLNIAKGTTDPGVDCFDH